MKSHRLIVVIAIVGGALASSSALPPEPCVRALREARIASFREDATARDAACQAALDRCGYDTTILLDLERIYRTLKGHEKQQALVKSRLRDLLYAAERAPDMVLVRRFLNDVREEKEQRALLDGAIEGWLTRDPDDHELRRAHIDLLLRQRELARARGHIRHLPPEWIDETLAAVTLRIDIEMGNWQDALPVLEELAARDALSQAQRRHYLHCLAESGDAETFESAIEPLIEELADRRYRRRSSLTALVFKIYDTGAVDVARRVFRKLRDASPDDPEFARIVEHLFATPEERAAAADAWKRQQNPHTLVTDAGKRIASGDAKSALPILERAVTLDAKSEVAWFNLGLAALQLKKYDRAEEALSRALTIAPRLIDAHYNRGITRLQLRRYEEALADLALYTKARPKETAPWFYVYQCHKALGDAEAANAARARYEGK